MTIVEEHIILGAKFYSNLLWVSIFAKDQNFDLDSLKCANLLRSSIAVLDPKLEWNFSIVDNSVSLS